MAGQGGGECAEEAGRVLGDDLQERALGGGSVVKVDARVDDDLGMFARGSLTGGEQDFEVGGGGGEGETRATPASPPGCRAAQAKATLPPIE